MPVIYIRHGNDEYSNPTYRHDQRLTQVGKEEARATASKIISRYGHPDIIYCTPFRRGQDTVKAMGKIFTKPVPINLDHNLSRYFTKKDKKDPCVCPETKARCPCIYETKGEFKLRVHKHIKAFTDHYQGEPIVWCLSHAVILKNIAREHRIPIPEYIPFLYAFRVALNYKPPKINPDTKPKKMQQDQIDALRDHLHQGRTHVKEKPHTDLKEQFDVHNIPKHRSHHVKKDKHHHHQSKDKKEKHHHHHHHQSKDKKEKHHHHHHQSKDKEEKHRHHHHHDNKRK